MNWVGGAGTGWVWCGCVCAWWAWAGRTWLWWAGMTDLYMMSHLKFILSINSNIPSIIYGGYPIIKQKLSERDLSREWIDMKTLK